MKPNLHKKPKEELQTTTKNENTEGTGEGQLQTSKALNHIRY